MQSLNCSPAGRSVPSKVGDLTAGLILADSGLTFAANGGLAAAMRHLETVDPQPRNSTVSQ